ncbi:hypothetical protein H6785_03260 [Candidatus Nomurabacteria bacterium]|nr:hypothetical protein [Candidatus Kaiserbacteria bacterium]MCB9815566.1 hypothetical protein [Candidatus Nomurabacteria bacterium]
MTKKWNLQDIRPAEPRKSRAPRPTSTSPEPAPVRQAITEREHIPSIVIQDGTNKESRRLIVSVFLFIVIVGGAVGLSALMGKTELTINPEHRTPNISAEFVAYPNKRDAALSYEVMTLETTGEAQVKATGQIQVEKQTTGKIEIIKTTPGTERLIKNTRFRGPGGLIFRIQESVVVPGAVKDGEGASVPGTIQAEVFADEPGEEYNLPAGSAFTIPGFEENGFTELYKSITARNPESFTGGYSGPQFKIDESELSTARQALQIQLRDNLLMRIDSEKPADFIAFKDSVAITYNQLPAVEYGQDLVTIKEQSVLQVPLFQVTEFGSFLAKETVPTYEGGPVRVDDTTALTFQYTSPTTSSSIIANEPSLTFKLTGKPLLIWEYDAKKLANDLAGLPKTAINNAITAYPGISSAIVHITPFWKRTFAEDPEEIIIIEELKDIE